MAVSDTIAASKHLDGVAIVVKAGVANRQVFAEAMRQLRMVNVRIMGFIYRDAEASGKNYSNRNYKVNNAYER